MNQLIKFKKKIERKSGHILSFNNVRIEKSGWKIKSFKDNYYVCKKCNCMFWIYTFKGHYHKKYIYIMFKEFNDYTDGKIISCNELIIKNIIG